jgi:hypothetical protein
MKALLKKCNVENVKLAEKSISIELSLFFWELIRIWDLRLFK